MRAAIALLLVLAAGAAHEMENLAVRIIIRPSHFAEVGGDDSRNLLGRRQRLAWRQLDGHHPA